MISDIQGGWTFGRKLTLAAVVAAVSVAAVAGNATAAQRYASPAGNGTVCTLAAPCDIQVAVEGATAGDEVVVGAGTYDEGADTINVSVPNLVVRGASSGAKPMITSSASDAIAAASGNTTLRDLEIVHTNPSFAHAVVLRNSSTAERLIVTSAGADGTACLIGGGTTLRDSLCYATGARGVGVLVDNPVGDFEYLRNVTAIATGPDSLGVQVSSGTIGTTTLDARNVIAQGVQSDIRAVAAPGGAAIATLSYSDYATTNTTSDGSATITPPGSGTNITGDPTFVDATAGNFHQQPSSPTVNAGATDSRTGSLDFDGEARVQGPSIDIGSDELAQAAEPPSDTSPPQTSIDKSPKKKTTSKKATFGFSAGESGAAFECKLDKKAFMACASPRKYKGLETGKHKFAVRAIDSAGNADDSPATYRWKVKKRNRR